MLNQSADIYKSFVTALSGITYDGNSIPVYSISPPKNPGAIFIQLGTITTVEEGCKDLFGHECTMDIQVIDESNRNYTSPKVAEEVSGEIQTALKTNVLNVVTMTNFNMIYLVLDNAFNDGGLFESDRSYRKIMQFRFMIEEIASVSNWILTTGFWNDSGVWIDDAVWID